MRKILLSFFILISITASVLADEKGFIFDSDLNYDIYFSSVGESSFVLRRVKIIEQSLETNEPFLVVKSDRFLSKSNRAYVFMKNVYTIVPSDYFQVEKLDSNSKK